MSDDAIKVQDAGWIIHRLLSLSQQDRETLGFWWMGTISADNYSCLMNRALNKADKESKTVTRKSSPVKVAPVPSQRPGHAQPQPPARKQTIRKVVTNQITNLIITITFISK